MTTQRDQKSADRWAHVVTRAWQDPVFKKGPLTHGIMGAVAFAAVLVAGTSFFAAWQIQIGAPRTPKT